MTTNEFETLAYSIRALSAASNLSRSFIYLEIKAGRLKIFKAGRRTLVSREAALEWQRKLNQKSP